MVLAKTLKVLRFRKGQSLQGVADAVGVSKAHIWELETGKSKNPSIELLRRLAGHFGTTVLAFYDEDLNEAKLRSEGNEALVLFREIKNLDDRDRRTLENVIRAMKATSKETDKGEN